MINENEPREITPLKMVSKNDPVHGIMDFSPRPLPADTPEEVVQPDPKGWSAPASAPSSVLTVAPEAKFSPTDSLGGPSPEDLRAIEEETIEDLTSDEIDQAPSPSAPRVPTAPVARVST